MGAPVVIAGNGIGIPVRAVESGAPVLQVAENGLGVPIVLSDLGAPFVVVGAGPAIPDISAIYFDHTDHAPGVVTTLPTRGSLGLTLVLAGTGADVVMGADGLTFNNGRYLRLTTGFPTTQYASGVVLLDMTITADPAATAYAFMLDLNPATSRAEVRVGWKEGSTPSAGYLTGAYGPNGALLRSSIYQPAGQRFTVAYGFDFVSGLMSLTDNDGYTETMLAGGTITPMQLGDIRVGQGCVMTLHSCAVILEAL